MSRIPSRVFFKLLLPLALLLLGCSTADRLGYLLWTPTPTRPPTEALTSTPSPTPTATAVAVATITPTGTVRPAIVPTETTKPTATRRGKKTPKPTPVGTPTDTPTPTPTPAPYSFYLNAYQPKCADGEPKAEVKVVDDTGATLPDITVELRNEVGTPVATRVTDGQGRASFPVGQYADKGWTVRVSNDSGGGALGRSVKVSRPDLKCDAPYTVQFEFQRAQSNSTDWPERKPLTAVSPREKKDGPWSPQQVRPLSEWPRPPHDNAWGIHFLPIGYYADWVVDLLIKHLHELHMTWSVVLYEDDSALRIAAQRFRDAGIMVIWRPNIRPDASYIYMKRDLDILRDLGVPPYIQIFNEPEVSVEWEADGQIRIKHFADNWIKFADEVYAAGGYPGVQVVDPETLKFLIDRIKEKGKEYLFNDMFFVAHPYGSNHPPDYPYDANMQSREPGKTADQDWINALGFLKYAHVYQEKLGFVPPFIIGEGGWTVTVREDDKYPAVNLENHRDFHLEAFSWFKNRSLSNGEPLPDYLFAFCPWLVASGGEMAFDHSSWYGSELSGTKKLTIKAMSRMPPFERKFSWDKSK